MMNKEKIKAYIYTRVSTNMQTDGYSLEAKEKSNLCEKNYNQLEQMHNYIKNIEYLLL